MGGGVELVRGESGEAAAMGDRARKLVDEGLDSEHFAKRMAGIFEEVLNQPGDAL